MENAKRTILLGSTIISLVALLVYTFFHTGATLARYVEPWYIGYIAAFGIETAVISMSIRIGDLRKAKQETSLLIGVLIAVLGVSTLANVSEGFKVLYGEPLTLSSVQQLDWVQAVIGLASTGLISVVVFAMSEVVSADVDTVVREHEKERKAAERKSNRDDTVKVSNTEALLLKSGAPALPIEQARSIKEEQDTLDQEARERHIYNLLKEGVDTPNWSQLARDLQVSRQTVYNDRDRLLERGVIAEADGQWIAVNGFHPLEAVS